MAGAKLKDGDILYVSNAEVTTDPLDAAAYEAILADSTPVSFVVSAPDLGYASAVANHDYLDSTFSSPDAGIKTGTSSEITYGNDTRATPDAGQLILQSAASSRDRRVVTLVRLDGSATAAWVLVSDDNRTGGSNGSHNERVTMVTVAGEPVDYTPA